MKYHPSTKFSDLRKRSPDVVALMVASEFSRMASMNKHPDNVSNAFHRARELMGVFETMPITESIAQEARPSYISCSNEYVCDGAAPEEIEKFSENLTNLFITIAEKLKEKPHA